VVTTTWDAPLVCVCHPSLTVTNAGQAPQTVSTRVVVLPWWLLVGLVLVLAAVAVLVVRRRSRTARAADQTGPDAEDLEPSPAGHG
jgi:beta-lactamase regulating signal transducer with metallopeptidase domain